MAYKKIDSIIISESDDKFTNTQNKSLIIRDSISNINSDIHSNSNSNRKAQGNGNKLTEHRYLNNYEQIARIKDKYSKENNTSEKSLTISSENEQQPSIPENNESKRIEKNLSEINFGIRIEEKEEFIKRKKEKKMKIY